MALDPTINLISAYRGAAGDVAIAGAVRARLQPNMEKKVSRAGGSELPDRVWMVGAAPKIFVETEDSDEWLAGLTGESTLEKLILNYKSGLGNKALTVFGAELVDVGELPIEPRAGSGKVSRFGLTFAVVVNDTYLTLAALMTVT